MGPTESNPDGGVRDKNDPTTYPSGGEIKPDTPSTTDTKFPDKTMKKGLIQKGLNAANDAIKGMVNNSYDPLSNKEILGISEKILKKNFDLGEEGYDIARDEGKVKPSKDKKDATTMPPSEEMKKTQKKSKGKSALELVKAKYKDSIMDTEK